MFGSRQRIVRSTGPVALVVVLGLVPFVASAQVEGGAYPVYSDEVAQLPEVHLAKAASLEKEASAFTREAEGLRDELRYLTDGTREPERANRDPVMLEMRRRLESYIEKLEAVAREGRSLAAFHASRWEALTGKRLEASASAPANRRGSSARHYRGFARIRPR